MDENTVPNTGDEVGFDLVDLRLGQRRGSQCALVVRVQDVHAPIFVRGEESDVRRADCQVVWRGERVYVGQWVADVD